MKLFFILIFFLSILLLNLAYPLKVFSSQFDNEHDIVSGVVPHHLLAEKIIDKFFKYISSQGKVENIILLSPDHFQSAVINHNHSFITYDHKPDNEFFSGLAFNAVLFDALSREIKLTGNRSAITYDHGITNLLPFIKKYLPETKILPILIPKETTQIQIEELVEAIDKNTSLSTVIIASVDFSHYLPQNAADFHDKKSMRVLLNFEQDKFKNIEVDCWQALYAIRYFAKLRDREIPLIIDHKCANDFLDLESEETTSYFSLVYGSNNPEEIVSISSFQEEIREVKTIMFTGDIMLDRGVEELINQNNINYPFQNILQFLKGIDIVCGNLEGPIVGELPDFSPQCLKFAFGTEISKAVSSAGFNLLSLANNHASDMGIDGFKETKKNLMEYQIPSTGSPFYEKYYNNNDVFLSDDIIFSAFNRILPFKTKDTEILDTIKELQVNHPEKFMIINMHWGNEYQGHCSSAQRELAHQMIEAGADLIIGHHPHVVQNIENYRDRLIFYSLGNFIFDQYFSEETQEGLAVGLEIYLDKSVFRLFPLQIDLCQPALMNNAKAQFFLKQLAECSDVQLADEIESGIIIVKRR